MPIYEYACAACGHTFEEWQKMSDPPVRTCPKCKKKKVEKLISQTAFQLKGGGWYADLYSSSKPGAKPGEPGKPGSKDGGSGASSDAQGSTGGGSEGAKGSDSGGKGADAGASAAKKDHKGETPKGDTRDAKKKDSPKKSEARAA